MIISVNRNYIWSKIFVEELVSNSVKYVCISPGSRSTPLSIAFSENKEIKTFVNIDERSSGFFALGLAKKTGFPVAVVTTSGTAVAELFPAVIEAFYSRVHLIICSADRPIHLLDCGANQTIKQDELFGKHVKMFYNLGLPDLSKLRMNQLKTIAFRASEFIHNNDKGPVHLNFPFSKPLEPDSYTDGIDDEILAGFKDIKLNSLKNSKLNEYSSSQFSELLSKSKRPIIIIGPSNYSEMFFKQINIFANKYKVPIFIDAASGLRYKSSFHENFIVNFPNFLRIKSIQNLLNPDVLISIGKVPTSNYLSEFIKSKDCIKISIDNYGDSNDTSHSSSFFIKHSEEKVIEFLNQKRVLFEDEFAIKDWFLKILEYEQISERFKEDYLNSTDDFFEANIITELIKNINTNDNIFVSNSLAIRDFDYFSSLSDKLFNIYFNRGASGIDGIIATTAGIAASSEKSKTYLYLGDLAFFYDATSMYILKNLKLNVDIILINNDGGGIFEMLPVSKNSDYFEKLFKTPIDLNISKLVEAFSGQYYRIEELKDFSHLVRDKSETFRVFEFLIDSKKSADYRKEYWKQLSEIIEKRLF